MSGTISLSADERWSAASWLFDWVLKDIAKDTRDVELAGHLTGVVDENLGWFALADVTPSQRNELRRIVKENLVEDADRDFPATMPERSEVLRYLADLATKVSSLSAA